jgi:hypothetical protein
LKRGGKVGFFIDAFESMTYFYVNFFATERQMFLPSGKNTVSGLEMWLNW